MSLIRLSTGAQKVEQKVEQMIKPRFAETDQGIQGQFNVNVYDRMMRGMRDKGWIETNLILEAGIRRGLALEIGPGPGYLGLEWLTKTKGTTLRGLEISPETISIAEENARKYGLQHRVIYIKGNAEAMPFEDNTFDAAFTNGSLHEWSHPKKVLNEIHRVLKPARRYLITNIRRDMNPIIRWFMWIFTKPKDIRPYLVSSIDASYTAEEIRAILDESDLVQPAIRTVPMGLVVAGVKPAPSKRRHRPTDVTEVRQEFHNEP
jgi:ubiquinone/menaquinone biosynthesis C-methylase UbiE